MYATRLDPEKVHSATPTSNDLPSSSTLPPLSSFLHPAVIMSSPLTAGFCREMYNSADTPEGNPILQVLSIKRIQAANSNTDRFR